MKAANQGEETDRRAAFGACVQGNISKELNSSRDLDNKSSQPVVPGVRGHVPDRGANK